VQRNIDIDSSSGGGSRCVVLPHVWGERPYDDLLAHMPFDCVVISECLWKRDALLSSLSALLINGGDVCLLRFQPPPGGLRERGQFFVKAPREGLEVTDRRSVVANHMWSDRKVDVYVFALQKRA
jgi:hypothetical protein